MRILASHRSAGFERGSGSLAVALPFEGIKAGCRDHSIHASCSEITAARLHPGARDLSRFTVRSPVGGPKPIPPAAPAVPGLCQLPTNCNGYHLLRAVADSTSDLAGAAHIDRAAAKVH